MIFDATPEERDAIKAGYAALIREKSPTSNIVETVVFDFTKSGRLVGHGGAAELAALRARVAELEAAAEEIRRLHTDSPMGPCPVCVDEDALVKGEDYTVPWPCPTAQHASAVESRPVDEDPIAYALTEQAEDVSPQVRQLRELIGRQREDRHDDPVGLHHAYRTPRDLPPAVNP